MRFPFVSKARYAEAVGALGSAEMMTRVLQTCLDNERQNWAAERDRMTMQYADLMSRYTMLRLQGFEQPIPQPTLPKREPQSDVELAIARAIREQSRGNGDLAKRMREQVKADRAAGIDEHVILAAIEGRVPLNTSEGII